MLKEFEPSLKSMHIVPSDGGRFEVSMNGKLVYSKLETGRHAEPGEVLTLARDYLRQNP